MGPMNCDHNTKYLLHTLHNCQLHLMMKGKCCAIIDHLYDKKKLYLPLKPNFYSLHEIFMSSIRISTIFVRIN
jgi:hypothetical protein